MNFPLDTFWKSVLIDDENFREAVPLDIPTFEPHWMDDDGSNYYNGENGNTNSMLQEDNIPLNEFYGGTPHLHRRERVQRGMMGEDHAMLNNSSSSEDAYEGDDSSEGEDPNDPHSVKHRFRDSTWSRNNFTYYPKLKVFQGSPGPTRDFREMPTFMQLFSLFWPNTLLRKIVRETNRYATTPDEDGNTRGGQGWLYLTIGALKAYLATRILMGLKKQPNTRTYWMKEGSFFRCPRISKIFSRTRFEAITRCLHVTNPSCYVREKELPGYDKMGQLRWLVHHIRDSFKREWALGKFLTVDEMMIRYKGSYCPARQYMPKKPQKWGIKVWCLADSSSKYVYNFEIYCGANHYGVEEIPHVVRREANVAHNVVMRLLNGQEGKGHVVVTDNYFSSIGLFTELATLEIYATGTMRSNRVGLPNDLKAVRNWIHSAQGTLEWAMHNSREIACVMWKDKRPVLLISTHALPIGFPCVPVPTVPRRNGARRDPIQTSPIHLEYTTHMRGVDVADQLRASYSCQTRSHKWWHRVFYFLLDTTVVNMYVIYLGTLHRRRHPRRCISHLQFKTRLCDALTQNWHGRGGVVDEEEDERPHLPTWSRLRRACIVCGDQKCAYYCRTCNRVFLCLNRGCFEEYHYGPRNHHRGNLARRP